MTSPIPFTPEDWKRLEPQGWRFGITSISNVIEEGRFIGLTKQGNPVWQYPDGSICSHNGTTPLWILPPRQVIEFQVGLFGKDEPFVCVINDAWNENDRNFIRLLTKDEMRDGVVEI